MKIVDASGNFYGYFSIGCGDERKLRKSFRPYGKRQVVITIKCVIYFVLSDEFDRNRKEYPLIKKALF